MSVASTTKPLTPEVLAYGLVTAADPQVSPDGKRILYVVRSVDAETHRVGGVPWRCDVDGTNAMAVPGFRTGAPAARWSPSSGVGTRRAWRRCSAPCRR